MPRLDASISLPELQARAEVRQTFDRRYVVDVTIAESSSSVVVLRSLELFEVGALSALLTDALHQAEKLLAADKELPGQEQGS